MRYVMTRVLPLPAPARMSTGPSVASTASSCCGLRSFAKSIQRSFYRNALCQIARLIDIASAADRAVIGEQLKRNDFKNRKQQLVGGGKRNEVIGAFDNVHIAIVTDCDDNSVTRLHFLNIVEHFVVTLPRALRVRIIRREETDWQVLINER